MQRGIVALVAALGVGLTLLTFGGFFGRTHWLLDVVAHFRLQYAVALGLLALGTLFWQGRRRYALWLLPALLANLAIIVPYFLPTARAAATEGEPLRVLALNVFAHNDTPQAAFDYVAGADADVVLLSEVTPRLMEQAQATLGAAYPYVEDAAERGHFGMVLFSRLQLGAAQTHRLGLSRYPSIQATVVWQGRPVTLYGLHPHPPLGAWGTERRDREMAEIQAILAAQAGPLIVMGDFNATPWTYTMQDLFKATSLRHAAVGYGLRPTWRLGTIVIGLPYDHVLVSPEWEVLDYGVGPDVGSDHYAVLAELTMR